MKIFIDSADIDEVGEAISWGIVSGVTTNPTLIKKAMEGRKVDIRSYLEEFLALTGKLLPVSLEVDGTIEGRIRTEQMIEEGKRLYSMFKDSCPQLNIKIPINSATGHENQDNQYEGLKAIRALNKEDIPVNATLIMTPEQALLAAEAGAAYISPFMGRIDDYIEMVHKEQGSKERKESVNHGILSGNDLIRETMAVLRPYETQVIAASIRNVEHVREAAKAGAHIATIPFKVIREMLAHPKTYEGVGTFQKDMMSEYTALLRGN